MTQRRHLALGDFIHAARMGAGLSMTALGERVGVGPVTVSRWERRAFAPGRSVQPALVAWARTIPPAVGEPLLRALGAPVTAPSPVPTQAATRAERERTTREAIVIMADTLDVGARSLRRALLTLIHDLESRGAGLDVLKAAASHGAETRRPLQARGGDVGG